MIKSDPENTLKSNPSQPVFVHLQCPVKEDDEINLPELWQQLSARKSLIFSITALFAIVSIISVLMMPKIWQAKIHFMPPELKNVQGLNLQEFNEVQYTQSSVYNKYLTNYQSANNKRKFFNQNNLINYYQGKISEDKDIHLSQIENAFKKFKNSLKLNLPKKNSMDELIFVTSTLDFSDQKASSKLLNQYAKMIKKDTLNNLLQVIISQLKQKQTNIKEQILIKKRIAKQIRDNRIVVLNEAIQTAKLLNLDEAESQFIKGTETGSNNPIYKSIPLYFQGYKSLEAEKKVLKERTDDAPFIHGLTELQYQNLQLSEKIKRLSNEKEKFSVAKIDQEAIIPGYPIKPKSKLIVIISTILGFILSLFMVFILKQNETIKI